MTKIDFSKRIMDNPEKLERALSGKSVFMTTNNLYYTDNALKQYKNKDEKPIEKEGKAYISESFLSLLGVESNIDKSVESIEKDGVLYYSAKETLEKATGKKYTYDGRGVLILAPYYVEVQRDHFVDRHIMWHEADLIYRFMQFDNPSGYKMLEDLKKSCPDKMHPRLLLTEDDIKFVKERIDSDEYWKSAYKEVIAKSERISARDHSETYAAQRGRRQLAAVQLQFQIVELAWGYLLTGNEKYAKKGVEMLDKISEWDSLFYEICNLISGHWAQVVAIGFDTFYNYMLESEYGREVIKKVKEATKRLIIEPHIKAYQGESEEPHYITMQDNFSGVNAGGVMSLLVAMADEEEYEEEFAFLLENCLRTLTMAASLYYPDGGYYESVGYSQYMLRNFVLALVGMKNTFKTDYGIIKARGFEKAGMAFVDLQSTDYNVNYHDCDRAYVLDSIRDALAYVYDNKELAALNRRQKILGGNEIDIQSQFYNSRVLEGIDIDISDHPLDAYFEGAHAGAFHNAIDIKDQTFVGFHGGYTGLPHDMLDLGEFMFESDGVIWAYDLGGDDYGLDGYFEIRGYRIYRKSAQGKNVVVINPTVDSENYWGQATDARAELILLDMNKPSGAMAAYDLTSAYKRDVSEYKRGYYFSDMRSTLQIRDEIKLKEESEVYWFMHTGQEIEIISNNKAVLKSKDGKKCFVDVLCNSDNFTLSKMEAKPLPGTVNVEGQADNEGFSKIAIHFEKAPKELEIMVKLSPIKERSEIYNKPILEWEI